MRGFAQEALIITVGVLLLGGISFGVPRLIDAAGADGQYDACVAAGTPASQCEQQWKSKIKGTCPDVGAVGQCSQDPDCKTYCTESGTSQGGINSCCKGGPKEKPHEPNKCPKEADGKCDPKKEDGKGGEPPKMPEIPKKEDKPTEPKNPLDQKCQDIKKMATTSPEYKALTTADRLSCGINDLSNSLSDLYRNVFGNNDTENTVGKNTDSSVEDILESVTTQIKTNDGTTGTTGTTGSTKTGTGVTQNGNLTNTAVDPNLVKGGTTGKTTSNTNNTNLKGVVSTFSDGPETDLLPASDPGFLAQAQSILTNIASWLASTFAGLF
ncbi:MAG: hypothetical protein KBE09_05295 [Candidatus Pacebacteria bacterium]|nr:hypothetical protein [Candidatus Paceibacterota bacterium]